jgi:protein-disulfide isomerase
MDQVPQDSDSAARPSLATPVGPDDHILGNREARVTLLEYGEFECPHCGRAHFHLKRLRDRLEELDARFVFRHLALDHVHPFSVRAGVTAEAAGAQGRFWEMHDHLLEHQHQLEYEDLRRHADAVGLDMERFRSDFRDPVHLETVMGQGDEALRIGIDATPAFFLNGRLYEGSYDFDSLVAAIRAERST